jgi:hypothetical protein
VTHEVEGYVLRFPHIGAWKVRYRVRGQSDWLGEAPVAWRADRRGRGNEQTLDVWYRDRSEMEAQITNGKPFVVALAEAENWEARPLKVKELVCLYEVMATGRRLDGGIETKVLRRLRA